MRCGLLRLWNVGVIIPTIGGIFQLRWIDQSLNPIDVT